MPYLATSQAEPRIPSNGWLDRYVRWRPTLAIWWRIVQRLADRGNGQSHGYDGLSIGILSSLKGVGYGSGHMPMPIVSGQDAEVPSIKSMLRGEQYSTIFKDTRDLARVTADMVDAALSGKTVTRQ